MLHSLCKEHQETFHFMYTFQHIHPLNPPVNSQAQLLQIYPFLLCLWLINNPCSPSRFSYILLLACVIHCLHSVGFSLILFLTSFQYYVFLHLVGPFVHQLLLFVYVIAKLCSKHFNKFKQRHQFDCYLFFYNI